MARQMAAGELQTTWFERHGSTPITEIPDALARRLPDARRAADRAHRDEPEHRPDRAARVQAPLEPRALGRPGAAGPADLAARPPGIRPLLARPGARAARADHGPRWPTGPAHDAEFLQVAALYRRPPRLRRGRAGRRTGRGRVGPVPARAAVQALGPAQAGRSGSGPGTSSASEDAGEDVGRRSPCRPSTPRPTSSSRLLAAAGQARRAQGAVVSYPHCQRDGDPSLVVGWAGWDHLQQATALAAYYDAR